jgi:hypothetical protein
VFIVEGDEGLKAAQSLEAGDDRAAGGRADRRVGAVVVVDPRRSG